MDFPKLGGEVGRRRAVTKLPAGRMKSLTERTDHQRSFPEFVVTNKASMRLTVEHNVLINFVGEQETICIAHNICERIEVIGGQNRTGRIVREVKYDQPRLIIDRIAQSLPVRMEIESVLVDE